MGRRAERTRTPVSIDRIAHSTQMGVHTWTEDKDAKEFIRRPRNQAARFSV